MAQATKSTSAPAYDDLSFLPVDVTDAAPPPFEGPTPSFDEASKAWDDLQNSRKNQGTLQQRISQLHHELQVETTRLRELEAANSSLFSKTRQVAKSPIGALKGVLGKDKNKASPTPGSLDESYPDEAKQRVKVEALKTQLAQSQRELHELQILSEKEDLLFHRLAMAASGRVKESHEMAAAARTLNTAESEVQRLHVVAADLARARLTVQHAHMYHKQVLNTTDRVRSKKFNMTSMISPMNLVEMDEDRREGVKESIRAQACLNESLRLLDKHNAMLPQDIAAQVTRVRELGVSQIVKMYNMLHGTSSDVAQQMDVLSQRQEEAFACLTKIAVWLQNTVPQCERAEHDAKEGRYTARVEIARLWFSGP